MRIAHQYVARYTRYYVHTHNPVRRDVCAVPQTSEGCSYNDGGTSVRPYCPVQVLSCYGVSSARYHELKVRSRGERWKNSYS